MPWEDYKLFVNDKLKYSANKHGTTTVHDGPSVPGRNARWHRSNDDKLKMISEMGRMKLKDPDNIEAQTLFRAFVLKLAQDVSSYETVTSRLKSWDPQSDDTKFVRKALKEVWEDDVKPEFPPHLRAVYTVLPKKESTAKITSAESSSRHTDPVNGLTAERRLYLRLLREPLRSSTMSLSGLSPLPSPLGQSSIPAEKQDIPTLKRKLDTLQEETRALQEEYDNMVDTARVNLIRKIRKWEKKKADCETKIETLKRRFHDVLK